MPQSKGYYEAMDKCSSIRERMRRITDYNTHMLTHRIVSDDRFNTIALEDLDVKSMIEKSSKQDTLGKQRRRKSNARKNKYAKFYAIKSQIEYKGKLAGKNVIKINRYFPSSQKCSACGEVYPAVKDLRISTWVCPKCGVEHHRDFNAALNIKNEGFKKIMKQEAKKVAEKLGKSKKCQ